MFEQNSIVITTSSEKQNLIQKRNTLENYKIYTIQEFIKLFYFDYDKETLFYIINNYNVKYEIASIYINNLYYIEDKKYENSKLIFLQNLKQELFQKKLLKTNTLFKNYCKDKIIYFYECHMNTENLVLADTLKKTNKVEIIDEEKKKYRNKIYELENMEEEIVFIATEICKLIKKGIPLNKIYITNLNSEYRNEIKKIFPMFHIPFVLNSDNSIYGTSIVQQFLKEYSSNLDETLQKIQENIVTEEECIIYNQIVSIINQYAFCLDKNEVKEMIRCDLKNTKINKIDLENAVYESSLTNQIYDKDDYVFLCSFNQGNIPVIYKDEEYLTDNDKKELMCALTVDKNNFEKEKVKTAIESICNLIITYKIQKEGEECSISNSNELLCYDVEKVTEISYEYSNMYNKIFLTNLLDEYYKFGTKNIDLYTLKNHYTELPYRTYQHGFSGISKDKLHEYLENKLSISYSKLDKYFKCPFAYYIESILKLNIYEESFDIVIGNLFHSILEKYKNSSLSLDELWKIECLKLKYSFSKQEQFFLKKLKEELRFVINNLKEQEKFTHLTDELYEEVVSTKIPGELDINFSGKIDKIKYHRDTLQTIIAIIDYKTGSTDIDITTIPYGIGMQLPIYLYLAKHDEKIGNAKIAGFYLQKIINNKEIFIERNNTYEQQKRQNLLLQGYSNEDMNILSEFDTSFRDSVLIKSLKVKKDNTFCFHAKVLSEKQMEQLVSIVEDKIKEGAQEIENGNFPIAPKRIDTTNHGCAYCRYKDICFRSIDDIINLPKLEKEDIFKEEIGGELNGMDA